MARRAQFKLLHQHVAATRTTRNKAADGLPVISALPTEPMRVTSQTFNFRVDDVPSEIGDAALVKCSVAVHFFTRLVSVKSGTSKQPPIVLFEGSVEARLYLEEDGDRWGGSSSPNRTF